MNEERWHNFAKEKPSEDMVFHGKKDRMCKYCLDKLNLYMVKTEGKLDFKRLWRRS